MAGQELAGWFEREVGMLMEAMLRRQYDELLEAGLKIEAERDAMRALLEEWCAVAAQHGAMYPVHQRTAALLWPTESPAPKG